MTKLHYFFERRGVGLGNFCVRVNAKLRDDERTLSQAMLDDFKELQEAGIAHPDAEKLKALLTAETGPR